MSQYSLTIDGKAVTTTMTFHVLNPADETVVAACPRPRRRWWTKSSAPCRSVMGGIPGFGPCRQAVGGG